MREYIMYCAVIIRSVTNKTGSMHALQQKLQCHFFFLFRFFLIFIFFLHFAARFAAALKCHVNILSNLLFYKIEIKAFGLLISFVAYECFGVKKN